MNVEMNSESDLSEFENEDEDPQRLPSHLLELANAARNKSSQKKSSKRYDQAYELFCNWKMKNSVNLTTENVLLAYFQELSTKNAPNTLWSIGSMLKNYIKRRENIDIKNFCELWSFLKANSKNYKPKKAKVFKDEEIDDFVRRAPDDVFLVHKVVLIFGLNGAMRMGELVQLEIGDIALIKIAETGESSYYLAQIRSEITKTNIERLFTISRDTRPDYFCLVQQYLNLRSEVNSGKVVTNRLFLNYKKGRCICQHIGINKLRSFPKQIASYLNLPNPEKYTGHSLRRTSATKLINNGADMITLKRLGGWISDTAAQGYIDDSTYPRRKTENLLHASTRPSNNNHSSASSEVVSQSSIVSSIPARATPNKKKDVLSITARKESTPISLQFGHSSKTQQFDQAFEAEELEQTFNLSPIREIPAVPSVSNLFEIDDYLIEEFQVPLDPIPTNQDLPNIADNLNPEDYITEENESTIQPRNGTILKNCNFNNCKIIFNITKT